MLWNVYGVANVNVIIEVEADSEEEAFDEAYNQLADLECFCGNGGMDYLVGVDIENAHLEPCGITYESVIIESEE